MMSKIASSMTLVSTAMAHGWMVHPVANQPGTPGYSLTYDGPTNPEEWATISLSDAWYTNGIQCDGHTCETPTTQCAGGKEQNPAMCPGKANLISSCGVIWLCHPNSTRPFGNDCDGRRYIGTTAGTDWEQGSLQEVAYSIAATHGGVSGYRLCKRENVGVDDYGVDGATEQCFQSGHLSFEGQTCNRCPDDPHGATDVCYDAKEKVGEHGNVYREVREVVSHDEHYRQCNGPIFDMATFSVVEHVRVPQDLEPGQYVLSWRWDTADTSQVWSNCADINIVPSQAPAEITV